MNQQEQLYLRERGEQIQCAIHKQSIIQLNIGRNIQLGERLICGECNTLNQHVLNLYQAQQQLSRMYSEQQEIIGLEELKIKTTFHGYRTQLIEIGKSFEIVTTQIQTILNSIKKKTSQMISSFQQQLVEKEEQFTSLIEEYCCNTQLSKTIQMLQNSQTIDGLTLQKTAEFISTQGIVDGKLVLSEKVKIPDSTTKKINQFNDKIVTQLKLTKISLQNLIYNKEQFLQKLFLIDTKYKNSIQLDGHSDLIGAIAMSNDDKLIASGDHSGYILLWELDSKQIKQKFDGEKRISDLIFSADDKLLAGAQYFSPYDILIFDLCNQSQIQPNMRLNGHSSSVGRIVFSLDSQFVISGSDDKTMRIWSLNDQKCVFNLNLADYVNGVNISQDQKYILVCCNDGLACLLNSTQIQSPKELALWQAHKDYANGTTFTPDSNIFLTCGYKDIKLWNYNSYLFSQGSPQKVYQTENNNSHFWSIQTRLNGSRLISNDGKIRIWYMETGKLIETLDVPGGYQSTFDNNFTVSKDMKYILTGGYNSKLKVYECQHC